MGQKWGANQLEQHLASGGAGIPAFYTRTVTLPSVDTASRAQLGTTTHNSLETV